MENSGIVDFSKAANLIVNIWQISQFIEKMLYLKRPVIVKNIVTKEFKEQQTEYLNYALEQIRVKLEQMNFQGRRLISDAAKKSQKEVAELREELRRERENQEQIKELLERRLAQISNLQEGDIFVSGTYESPVKIEMGDSIIQKLSQAEIMVKDGIVIQIVESTLPPTLEKQEEEQSTG